MAQANSSKTNLKPEHDPCSAGYQAPLLDVSGKEVRSSMHSSRKIRHAKLGKKKIGFLRSLKRFFGVKSARPISFIMMNGSNKRLSESINSHSPARSNRNSAVVPNPPIYLTGPSTKRRSHYRVHSFEGSGSPPIRQRSSVRFAHPTVSKEILPATPSASSLLAVPENDEKDEQQSKRMSGATDISDDSYSPREAAFPSVRPKDIYLYSSQSVTTDGKRESYADFKQRLDGHKPRADRRSSQRPPSLSFIPRTGTIKLDEYDSPRFRSSFMEAAEAEKHRSAERHRSDALSRLEGKSPENTQDRYVLAVMKREDMPTTAIQISSDAHPSNLIPGKSQQPRPTLQRPHTFAGPASTGQTFQPYSPSAVAKDASAKRKGKMPAIVDEELIDAPLFDIQDTAGFHARHSQNYRRVESCDFEQPTPSRLQQPNRPLEQSRSQTWINSGGSFLLSPSPPVPNDSEESLLKAETRKLIMRKPVLVDHPPRTSSKPLAPTPQPQTSSKSVVPIAMNANGYPNIFPHPSKRYSATAKYETRTLNSVESKYKKEHPKKMSKSEKKAQKAQKSKRRL